MTTQDLKVKMERQPFRSFVIELTGGGLIVVGRESEILFPRKRPELAIVFTDDGLQHEFEDSAIVRISEAI